VTRIHWLWVLRIALSIVMVTTGVLHFIEQDAFVAMMPRVFAFPEVWVWFTGVSEVLGGVGLLIPRLRRTAAFWLIVLYVGVFPANVHMAVNSIPAFGVDVDALWLWLRLPLQLVFIAWAYHAGLRRNPRYFQNAVAIVTGAASGIGAALAKALIDRGATVVLVDRSENVQERALELGNHAQGVVGDVTEPAGMTAVASAAIRKHGHIDYLFNNAGVGMFAQIRDMSLDDWKRLMDVNFFGVVNCINAVYPAMVERRGGCIVNIASFAALVPQPGTTAYSASKGAVVGLSLALRGEAAPLGVRVCCACPGVVDTAIFDAATIVGAERTQVTALIPVRGQSAERCAAEILNGVEDNRSIFVVTRPAKLAHALFQIIPGANDLFALHLGRKIQSIRTPTPKTGATPTQ